MPGLVAIMTPRCDPTLSDCIIPMAGMMRHEAYYRMDIFRDRRIPFAAARVHPGNVNLETQPLINEDHSIFVFMEGEIHGREDPMRTIAASGLPLKTESDAELVLRLYELKGEHFVDDLNGSFLAVVFDARENKSVIANDGIGLCSAYYFHRDGIFLLASELKCLLRSGQVSRLLNTERLNEYFLYDGILDDETLIRDVRKIPNGSIWIYQDGKLAKRRYVDISSIEENPSRGQREFAEDVNGLFLRILPRYTSGRRVAFSLTGGWDTRAILAALHRLGVSLPTFTYGGPYGKSFDIRLARKITACLGVALTEIALGREFFERFSEYASASIYLSDGVADVFDAHSVYFSQRLRGLALIRLGGKYGTQTMNTRFLLPKPRFDQRLIAPRHLSQTGPLECTTRSFRDHQSIIDVIRWLWPQGDGAIQRCYVEDRAPFADRDLVNFLFSAPPSYLANASIQKHIISQNYPALARYPADKGTFIPQESILRESWIRGVCAFMKLGMVLDRGYSTTRLPHWVPQFDPVMVGTRIDRLFLGLSNIFSYRRWMKWELKDFFIGVLSDERTLSRPYLQPDFVQKIIIDHFSHRANFMNEICKIVSLELWHRFFIDGERIAA